MGYILETLGNLVHQTAFFNLTWGNYVMVLVAYVLLYLAIKNFCTTSMYWMSGPSCRP